MGRAASRPSRLAAWFAEASNLRRFAFWNIWFWIGNHPLLLAWYAISAKSFEKYGFLYLDNVSVVALWLSALAWWQSTRVEERQIDAEDESAK